jgi:hypothetical protein
MAVNQHIWPWDRQPQEAVEANPAWANRGLIGLWNFANGTVGTVGGDASFSGIPDFVASASGVGWKNTTISSNQRLVLPDLSAQIGITNEVTLVLILGGGNNTTQGLANIGGANDSTQSDHYPYRPASTDLIYSSLFKSNRWVSGVTSLVDHTKPHVVGVQFKNGLQRYTQAGRQLATASNSVNPIWPTWARLLVSDNTAFAYSGATLGAAVFNRYLPDAELFEITKSVEDSWQLFAPRSIWVPVSAGGGGISATLTQTLADATVSSASTLAIKGTVSQTLADATTTATGTLALKGATTQTLADATLAATGALAVTTAGVLSATLAAATVVSTGTVALKAAVTQTLEAATLASSATLAIKGTTSQTLADATLSAQGTAQAVTTGTLSATLADATVAAAAKLAIAAYSAPTLADATLVATATMPLAGISAAVGVTLGNATLASTATVLIKGSATITLGDCTIVASNVPTIFTDSEWWKYEVQVQDMRYSVPPQPMTFEIER